MPFAVAMTECAWCGAELPEKGGGVDEEGDRQCTTCERAWMDDLRRARKPPGGISYGAHNLRYLWAAGRRHTIRVWSELTGIAIESLECRLREKAPIEAILPRQRVTRAAKRLGFAVVWPAPARPQGPRPRRAKGTRPQEEAREAR